MNLSELDKHLKAEEGYRPKPYHCSEGRLTIGWGTNLDEGITKEEAQFLYESRRDRMIAELKRRIQWFPKLPDDAQIALVSMAYQMGIVGLMKFKKMIWAMERGDFSFAAREALASKWALQTPERAKRVAAMIEKG